MSFPFHPLANLFPLLEGDDFAALVASIAANGQREAVVLHEGLVLDGRNRQRACKAAGVDCRYAMLADGISPLQFVIDKNLRRRHLNESQRAFVAAKLANLGEGRPTASIEAVSQESAAAMLNVSRSSVQRAAIVQAEATDEIRAAVERGQIAVSVAAKASELPADIQNQIAKAAAEGKENVVRLITKRASRAARERELGGKQTSLPSRKFGIILADPEWRFEPWSRESGMDRSADNHYPTSCLEVIKARDVASIAAGDCVLFLWATVPMLPHALVVMAAWGFDYRSHFVWGKDRIGTGYWNRNRHELLLVGVKGDVPAPAPGTQWDSLINASVGLHSQKPDDFFEMIEAYFPTLPKIELNRRGKPRPGWAAWGNEAELSEAS